MTLYTYSIIIPHKNSSDLLQRCIASIPQRDDVQIIVVDDNSDEDKKPVIERQNVAIVYLDALNSKGAGHARNVGLSYATGKWVLFIDADDTYSEHFSHFLDVHQDVNVDVVYFGKNHVIDGKVNPRGQQKLSSNTHDEVFRLKFGQTVPWNKMVRHSLIDKNHIAFEECPVGNDIFYSYQVGFFCKENFTVYSKPVYNYFINNNSITHKRKNTEDYYLTIWKHIYQCNEFYRFMGRKEKSKTILAKLAAIWKKKGLGQCYFAFTVFVKHFDEIRRDSMMYVNRFVSPIQ